MATSNAAATAAPNFVLTPPGILSFPHLYTPKAPMAGVDPRYSCVLLFDEEAQKTKEYAALRDRLVACAKAEFGEKVNLASLKFPLRNAEEKEYQGYDAGKKFMNVWSKNRPGIIDNKFDPISDPSAVWAGQVARASVSPFAYNTTGNKGVSLGLRHVQILRSDMPRLDGRGSAESDFGNAPIPAGYEADTEADDDVPFLRGF